MGLFLKAVVSQVALLTFKAVGKVCGARRNMVKPAGYEELDTACYKIGDVVIATTAFESSGTPPFSIEVGMSGFVGKYGRGGETLVSFRGYGGKWIARNDLANLEVQVPPKRYQIDENSQPHKIYETPSVGAPVKVEKASGSTVDAIDKGDWLKLFSEQGFILREGVLSLTDKAEQKMRIMDEEYGSNAWSSGAVTPLEEANEADTQIQIKWWKELCGEDHAPLSYEIQLGEGDQTQTVSTGEIGETIYFVWQGCMALSQLVSIVRITFTRETYEMTSVWVKLNLVVYAFFNSGASLFLGQIAAKLLTAAPEGPQSESQVSHLKDRLMEICATSAWLSPVLSILWLCFINTIMTLLCLPSSPWGAICTLLQQLLALIIMFLAGGITFFAAITVHNSAKGQRGGLNGLLGEHCHSWLGIITVFMYQFVAMMVLVQVRINAGELEGSFFDPLYNDFQARTWYSVASCVGQKGATKANKILDLVQSWT